ncbi:hypothetical protein [Roseateles cavernae]|uniref:hypothetical protein n=1 Tax=Roseateles cavernae TaxID=3153578 RepID=UPI0032E4DD77
MAIADPGLLKEQVDDLVAEALAPRGVPERVHYANGVLLGAEDFAAEQLYLRGRSGRALAALYGHGTLAGLRVGCSALDNPELELQVAPGLALDRLGRLIEIRRKQCIHIARWLAEREAIAETTEAALERAAVIAAVRAGATGPVLVFDVWLRFAICPHGKTPAFAAGPFNASDYVVPARLADAFELSLRLAHVIGGELARPEPRSVKLEAMLADLNSLVDPTELEARRRAWCVASALDAWPQPSVLDPQRLPRLREQAGEADWDQLLLARVTVPVRQAEAGAFPQPDTEAIAAIAAAPEPPPEQRWAEPAWRELADNSLRPLVFNPYSWRGRLAAEL